MAQRLASQQPRSKHRETLGLGSMERGSRVGLDHTINSLLLKDKYHTAQEETPQKAEPEAAAY